MTADSASVATFLAAVQDCRERLRRLRGRYLAAGASRVDPVFNLSGRPFTVHEGESSTEYDGCLTLGLVVRNAEGREFDLEVDLLWTDPTWRIDTSARADEDDGGHRPVRELPQRNAADLPSCLEQLRAAVDDLAVFEDWVLAK